MTTTTSAKIVCDSVSPAGHRLTTFECVFPRIILAEVNTHRDKSRNSASSRAIPIEKMIARVLEDPYVPTHWGKNQRGMQAERDVGEDEALKASNRWKEARGSAVKYAEQLLEIGIHEQITNRLLEPFMWHTALVTGTEWSNFFNLRDNKDAHPDFRDLAHAMRELYEKEEPNLVNYDEWHLPLISGQELFDMQIDRKFREREPDYEVACKISVGRCARTSYLTHHGKRDPQADADLHDGLLKNGHMSPFEHVARPMTEYELDLFKQPKIYWDGKGWAYAGKEEDEYMHFLGNVQGWVQYRKLIPHEEDILGAR
jgi:thymidylate synthase ThyX